MTFCQYDRADIGYAYLKQALYLFRYATRESPLSSRDYPTGKVPERRHQMRTRFVVLNLNISVPLIQYVLARLPKLTLSRLFMSYVNFVVVPRVII